MVPHLTVAQLADERQIEPVAAEFAQAAAGKLPICATASEIALMDTQAGSWQVRTILAFYAIKADDSARNLFRARFGGSPDYVYRVVLSAIAPMFVIWGLLAGWLRRSWLLLLAAWNAVVVTGDGV